MGLSKHVMREINSLTPAKGGNVEFVRNELFCRREKGAL